MAFRIVTTQQSLRAHPPHLTFALRQGFGAPVGFAADSFDVNRGAFYAVDADAFAGFEGWFTGCGVGGPGRAEDLYGAFVKGALARRDNRPDLSRKRVDATAQRLTSLFTREVVDEDRA